LVRLSQQLAEAQAPENVLHSIAEALVNGLDLEAITITLKRPDAEVFDLAVVYPQAPQAEPPSDAVTEFVLPLVYEMDLIGQLIVRRATAAPSLTDYEQALLTNIAQHAGAAANIVRLTRDLRRARERLVLAREEERRRLRRDLHDSIGPTLAALNLKAGVLRTLIAQDPPSATVQMTELREQIREVITSIRRVVYNLRPPALDEMGMLPAIREHAAQFSLEGLQVTVEAPEQMPPMPAALEVATYRIVLEALTNVARHARARHCLIRLTVTHYVLIEVTDDGVGLAPAHRPGVGETSMRERATELGGTLALEPGAGGGTRLVARLPLAAPEPETGPLRPSVVN
jgi:signal transduction histidine kinase